MTHGELVDVLSRYSFDTTVVVWEQFPEEYEEDLDGLFCDIVVREGLIDEEGLLHMNAPKGIKIKDRVLVICPSPP